MGRLDHGRANARDRMRRQGVDRIDDFGAPAGLAPPKRRKAKAELRAEAEAALAEVTRIVRCVGCGHQAAVAIPSAMLGRRLRCSRCGTAANETPAAR
ncbi:MULTISPECIES: hypothetical protein [unclassified Chelatococcus]|uniref:hypothetical protein n=1 Tax=unclassified Chelatococcus TaxID=2638111 RepID=UPI00035E29CA|nr:MULTISPECIES: hypothetical protein [unclassified Chelatococcus]ALA17178.1 hypothetical protein AL346_06875 [Chelatococcus sp. CO-6]